MPDVPPPVLDKCLKAKRFLEEEAKLFMVVSDGNMYDDQGNLIVDKERTSACDRPKGTYNTYSAEKFGSHGQYSSVAKVSTTTELQHRQQHMCKSILAWTSDDIEIKRSLTRDMRKTGCSSTAIPPPGGMSLATRSLCQSHSLANEQEPVWSGKCCIGSTYDRHCNWQRTEI